MQGRIVFHVVPKESRTVRLLWIPPRFVTPIFVICDIIALLTQLLGAVELTTIDANDPKFASKTKTGEKIAQVGVAIQLVCFGLFSIIAIRFNFTSKRFAASFNERLSNTNEKPVSIDGSEKLLKRNWQAILRVTNFASVMILVSLLRLKGEGVDVLIMVLLDSFCLSYGRLLVRKNWLHYQTRMVHVCF